MHALPADHQRGFTLIEMLIVIGISMLMVGGGIAAFFTFNDKQLVLNGVRELQTTLRSAQGKAQVGDKPAGCDKLERYVVVANQAAPVTVQLVAQCTNDDVLRSTPFALSSTLSLAAPLDMGFEVLHGGVSNSGDITVQSTTGRRYTFTVSPGGEITQGEFVEQ